MLLMDNTAVSKKVLTTLYSSNFNYPGWTVDKKLVEKHATFDENAAMFRLDVMRRRQKICEGSCNHPVFLQIIEKEWTYPGNEWDIEDAIYHFKYGRDNFVEKVLTEGDQRQLDYSKKVPGTDDNDLNSNGGNNVQDSKHSFDSSTKRSTANSTALMVMKEGDIVGSLKRMQEFNRITREILDSNEEGTDIHVPKEHSDPRNQEKRLRRIVNETSNVRLRRRKEFESGSCAHPLYTAIMNRKWTHRDGDKHKKAALQYFRFGQDYIVREILDLADQKEVDWVRQNVRQENSSVEDFSPSESSSETLESTSDELSNYSDPVLILQEKISRAKDHINRRGNAARSRMRNRFQSVDCPLIRVVEERSWTYPRNEEDKKAAKYYGKNGHSLMVENILKEGDIKEESHRSLQGGNRSDQVLVALDTMNCSYPGWENDKKRIEEIFCDKERSVRILYEMESKQMRHDSEAQGRSDMLP